MRTNFDDNNNNKFIQVNRADLATHMSIVRNKKECRDQLLRLFTADCAEFGANDFIFKVFFFLYRLLEKAHSVESYLFKMLFLNNDLGNCTYSFLYKFPSK